MTDRKSTYLTGPGAPVTCVFWSRNWWHWVLEAGRACLTHRHPTIDSGTVFNIATREIRFPLGFLVSLIKDFKRREVTDLFISLWEKKNSRLDSKQAVNLGSCQEERDEEEKGPNF